MIKQPLNYPLSESAGDSLRAASDRRLADITPDAAFAGELSMSDFQISAETLRAQAEVARQAGYVQQADNLIRAAELTAVPNAEVLKMYNVLRPGRATYAELKALADSLENQYNALKCANLVREAMEVYRRRGLLMK